MAELTFADAAGKGYKFVWDHRRILMHFALWPVVLKIASFSLITALGYEENLLRQGLMLLPACFLEGWLIAYAVRFAVLGETRPEPLNTRDASPEAAYRRRCMMAAIIVYMLIKLAASLSGGLLMGASQIKATIDETASTGFFFVLVLMLVGMVWAFRLVWLHIPVALGYPVRWFLKKIEGFGISFYMLGLWILCAVPVVVVLLMMAKLLVVLFPGSSEDAPSIAYIHMFAAVQAVMETIVVVVSSVAMAFGLQSILTSEKERPRLF